MSYYAGHSLTWSGFIYKYVLHLFQISDPFSFSNALPTKLVLNIVNYPNKIFVSILPKIRNASAASRYFLITELREIIIASTGMGQRCPDCIRKKGGGMGRIQLTVQEQRDI